MRRGGPQEFHIERSSRMSRRRAEAFLDRHQLLMSCSI
jgi:hypothetical protein